MTPGTSSLARANPAGRVRRSNSPAQTERVTILRIKPIGAPLFTEVKQELLRSYLSPRRWRPREGDVPTMAACPRRAESDWDVSTASDERFSPAQPSPVT